MLWSAQSLPMMLMIWALPMIPMMMRLRIRFWDPVLVLGVRIRIMIMCPGIIPTPHMVADIREMIYPM